MHRNNWQLIRSLRRAGRYDFGQILVDPHGCDGTGEAHQQDARSYHGDQVDRPTMPASTDQVEVSGTAFVDVGVKAHDGPPRACLGRLFNRLPPKRFHIDDEELARQTLAWFHGS
jgi:hypothetical protein